MFQKINVYVTDADDMVLERNLTGRVDVAQWAEDWRAKLQRMASVYSIKCPIKIHRCTKHHDIQSPLPKDCE